MTFQRDSTIIKPWIITESAEDTIITKARALKELDDHCCEDIEQFFDDLGDHEEYDAQKVWMASY